jgi:hypothetical protein
MANLSRVVCLVHTEQHFRGAHFLHELRRDNMKSHLIFLMKSANYEVPHFVIFSRLLLFHASLVQRHTLLKYSQDTVLFIHILLATMSAADTI